MTTRKMIVRDGVAINAIVAGDDWKAPEGVLVVASETASIGDSYDGSAFHAPPAPPLSLADARSARAASVDAHRDALILAGFSYDFGKAGVHLLDQRDADDTMAWLTVKLLAADMVAAGKGGDPLLLRSADNVTFATTAAEAEAAMSAMAIWRSAIAARAWALKDQIAKASAEQIDRIDIAAGWPG